MRFELAGSPAGTCRYKGTWTTFSGTRSYTRASTTRLTIKTGTGSWSCALRGPTGTQIRRLRLMGAWMSGVMLCSGGLSLTWMRTEMPTMRRWLCVMLQEWSHGMLGTLYRRWLCACGRVESGGNGLSCCVGSGVLACRDGSRRRGAGA